MELAADHRDALDTLLVEARQLFAQHPALLQYCFGY